MKTPQTIGETVAYEIDSSFTKLFKAYSGRFPVSMHRGATRKELMDSVPKGNPGVYVMWREGDQKPFYIGSSGKVKKGLVKSDSTVSKRLFNSSTPYHFSKSDNALHYGPTSAGVPPDGYHDCIDLKLLKIDVFSLGDNIAPSAFEHILIQGFINEFGDLPEINQAI